MIKRTKKLIGHLVRWVYHFSVPNRAGYRYVAVTILRNCTSSLSEFYRRAIRKRPLVQPARNAENSTYHLIYPSESFRLDRPPEFNDSDWRSYQLRNTKSVPESFVLEMRNARVATTDGWVQTDSGILVSDIWSESGYATIDMAPITEFNPALPEVALGGTSACLTMPWLPNYYHWTFQVVPRFHLVSKVINPNNIDHWIIPAKPPAYVKQWLQILRIPDNKCFEAIPGVIQCERLLASSIPAPNRWIPSWAIDFVRSKALAKIKDTATPSKFYIARNERDRRRILNQRQLYQILDDYSISIIELEGRSVEEQVALFHQADLIIGLLGAALTNILYCKPGAKLIEILPKNLTFPCYFKLSKPLGIIHAITLGLEPRIPGRFYRTSPDADVIVNLAQVRTLLEQDAANSFGPSRVAANPALVGASGRR